MHAGFLVIAVDASNDGVLFLRKSDDNPGIEDATPNKILWVGRFKDIDAAQMHAHDLYRRQLLDSNAGSYTISKGRAIAAIEGDKLLKETVYIDPNLSPLDRQEMAEWVLIYKRRKQRFEAMILAIKIITVGFLLFIFVMGF